MVGNGFGSAAPLGCRTGKCGCKTHPGAARTGLRGAGGGVAGLRQPSARETVGTAAGTQVSAATNTIAHCVATGGPSRHSRDGPKPRALVPLLQQQQLWFISPVLGSKVPTSSGSEIKLLSAEHQPVIYVLLHLQRTPVVNILANFKNN
jgi:hypothetical protein